MKWNQIGVLVLVGVLCFSLTACGTSTEPAKTAAEAAPATVVSDHYAVIQTSMGDITVQLFNSKVPNTAKNFETLAQKGFYDNTIFHRVIDKFMIQGGDPTGTGRGGPGYAIKDEFGDGLTFDKPGMLAMANAGADTGGSQFFITVAPTKWLQGKHAIFGQVVNGYDVIEKISKAAVGEGDKPKTDIIITRITITEQQP